jgi:hypothetical protein
VPASLGEHGDHAIERRMLALQSTVIAGEARQPLFT